jgi:membrane protein implicated in regulation of membrane protease activity
MRTLASLDLEEEDKKNSSERPAMTELGKTLMVFGGVLLLIGLLLTAGARLPWLGRLPGDIAIQRENFSFYFPLTTCLLVSALLSLLFFLFRR